MTVHNLKTGKGFFIKATILAFAFTVIVGNSNLAQGNTTECYSPVSYVLLKQAEIERKKLAAQIKALEERIVTLINSKLVSPELPIESDK